MRPYTWDTATPEPVRKLITEAISWVNCNSAVEQLLYVRMERIYLQGGYDGLTQAQKAASDAISKIGAVRP